MIFRRCAFVVVYFALSVSNSSATASKIADLTVTREEIALGSTTIDRQRSVLLSTAKLQSESSQPPVKRSPNSIEKSAANLATVGDTLDSKSLTQSDLHLALGAMALTFSISLFLIWILFRKPSQKERITTTVTQGSELAGEATVKDNPIVERTVASSAVDLESDKSAIASPITHSNVADLNAVKIIQSLQSEADANQALSDSDSVARITQRHEAIWKLTETGDYRSIEPLLKIMPYAEEPDKSFIIAAVNKIIDRSFKPIDDRLFANLQDADPQVRLNAIRDLRNLYQFVTPIITKISQMQSDADYEVRQTAIQTLGQLNADPFPTFSRANKTSVEQKTNNLVSGEESEANLHLVAYLLAELDAEKQC